VVLVEPGPDGTANARRRGIRNVIRSTLDDAGFQDGRLAAVGLFDVLEHIQDDRQFLRSIGRYLARQGRLYLTVPALASLWSQEDVDAGHYRRYAAGGLKRLLAEAGYEAEYLTYMFRWLPPAILLARALPYRLGVRRTHPEIVERAREQHLAGGRVSRAVLKTVLSHELAVVRAGRTLFLGSSCLAVAKRL
jgi:SAM-dependent methyltransferase